MAGYKWEDTTISKILREVGGTYAYLSSDIYTVGEEIAVKKEDRRSQNKVLVAALKAEFGDSQIQWIYPELMEYYDEASDMLIYGTVFNDEEGISAILKIDEKWFHWLTYMPLGAHSDQHKGWVKVMPDGSSVYGLEVYGAEYYSGAQIYIRVKPGESDRYRGEREYRNKAIADCRQMDEMRRIKKSAS